MNTLKTFTVITSTIIIALLSVIALVEDPMEVHYSAVIEKLKELEQLEDESAILQIYPALKEAQEGIQKANELEVFIRDANKGQALPQNQNFSLSIRQKRQQVIQLRDEALRILQQFKTQRRTITPVYNPITSKINQ